MATKRGNPDQYLQKVGGTYYARVRVPRTLEKQLRQTHLRKSLETGERAEANRRKHAVVGRIKAELERLRKAPKDPQERGISFADALEWREEVKRLEAAGDHAALSTLQDVATANAEKVERLLGHDTAVRWHRIATNTADTLVELQDKWLNASDYRESTKHGHRKALAEVLASINNESAHPNDITRKIALTYIDTDLTQRSLAHNTIRDRLVSLGGFWSWMVSRGVVGTNPWTGHRISKKQNAGTRPSKRPGGFTPEELVLLLQGNDRTRSWPTWAYLPDLMVLGMFTGSRIEKLCDLTASKVEKKGEAYLLRIEGDKTDAGTRLVGVTHPVAVAVLKRRLKGRTADANLFPELTPGGLDDKMSASASKAFGRYRRACGVPDGTDFHSFRRNVVDILVKDERGLVEIARFVGHKVGALSTDTYAGQSLTPGQAVEVAGRVRYPADVEGAALSLVSL